MKQILLITDGCSNVGLSPVVAAAHAYAEGITVNVVGVLDQDETFASGQEEIADIAKSGGGMSRIVGTKQLSQTVQMMTRKTVVTTIQQAVNKELRQVFGSDSVEALPPEKRGEVVRVIDELGETTALQVALLIDASASMKPKMAAVEEAIRDLVLSLQVSRLVGGWRLRLRSALDGQSERHSAHHSEAEHAGHDADRTGDHAGHRLLPEGQLWKEH